MNKKIYYCLALAAMAMAGCTVDEGLTNDKNDVHKQAFNTTYFTASRNASGAVFAGKTRTITDVKTWEVAWNDGTNKMFDPSSKTGLDPNIDHIAFLATNVGEWGYLTDPAYRQVFAFNNYSSISHEGHNHLTDGKCCGDFVAVNGYEGLQPDVEYYGYYYQPYILDKRLPVELKSGDDLYTSLTNNGYDPKYLAYPEGVDYNNDAELQKWLATYDYLQARVHGSSYSTIKPSRDGIWNETTNSYDLPLIDMEHLYALVEVDLYLTSSKDNVADNFTINKVKMNAYNGSERVSAFSDGAALNKNAAWVFEPTASVPSYVHKNVISVYNSNANCTYSGTANGTKPVKLFMLIRQPVDANAYVFEVLHQGNDDHVDITWTPGGSFRFEPGKHYKFEFTCDMSAVDDASGYAWQSRGKVEVKADSECSKHGTWTLGGK